MISVRFFVYLVLLATVSGCSTISSVGSELGGWFTSQDQAPQDKANDLQRTSSGASVSNQRVPFDVVIHDEVNDGEKLFIRAGIRSRRTWPVADLVLLLTGTRDGEPVEQEVLPLASSPDLILSGLSEDGKELSDQEELLLSLSLPSAQITDYQLDLLWGSEAAPYLKRTAPAAESMRAGLSPSVAPGDQNGTQDSGETLHIRDFRVVTHTPNCGRANCPQLMKLEGKLVNTGPTTQNDVSLALVFRWIPNRGSSLDLSRPMTQNEELIQLRGIGLAPGGSKPFRFVLDRPIPQAAGGRYVPELRVANSASSSQAK